jgi:hypothetical protein
MKKSSQELREMIGREPTYLSGFFGVNFVIEAAIRRA